MHIRTFLAFSPSLVTLWAASSCFGHNCLHSVVIHNPFLSLISYWCGTQTSNLFLNLALSKWFKAALWSTFNVNFDHFSDFYRHFQWQARCIFNIKNTWTELMKPKLNVICCYSFWTRNIIYNSSGMACIFTSIKGKLKKTTNFLFVNFHF